MEINAIGMGHPIQKFEIFENTNIIHQEFSSSIDLSNYAIK
jgi:hypothetical protein